MPENTEDTASPTADTDAKTQTSTIDSLEPSPDHVPSVATPPTRRAWWRRLLRRPDKPAAEVLSIPLSACQDAVLGIDRHGTCVAANQGAADLFGCTIAQLRGVPASGMVPELEQLLAQAAAGEQPHATIHLAEESVHVASWDGTPIPVEIWLSAQPHQTVAAYVTLRDLRAQQQARLEAATLRDQAARSQQVLSVCTHAVRDRGIIVVDPQGSITSFNRAAEKMLGYRSRDVVGHPLTALSDPADITAARTELRIPTGTDPLLELTLAGLGTNHDWYFMTRDGDRVPVQVDLSLIGEQGNPSGFVVVAKQRRAAWEPLVKQRSASDRLLLDLDDTETRTMRWQVGSAAAAKRR